MGRLLRSVASVLLSRDAAGGAIRALAALVVHSRLRSRGHRGLLQVHQLGEKGRFLTESLEDNVQHGCEEDVE